MIDRCNIDFLLWIICIISLQCVSNNGIIFSTLITFLRESALLYTKWVYFRGISCKVKLAINFYSCIFTIKKWSIFLLFYSNFHITSNCKLENLMARHQSFRLHIVTIVPIFVGTCDLESLVASGHKKIWRPPAAKMGFCDFKDVVAFGNNQLWRPLAAKV